jgi:hypothetical protein
MRTPSSARRFDPWDEHVAGTADLVGLRVEAVDGHIGKIDAASTKVHDEYLVVDTGPWIFGRKVLVPAGTVSNVDQSSGRVYVDRLHAQAHEVGGTGHVLVPRVEAARRGRGTHRRYVAGHRCPAGVHRVRCRGRHLRVATRRVDPVRLGRRILVPFRVRPVHG